MPFKIVCNRNLDEKDFCLKANHPKCLNLCFITPTPPPPPPRPQTLPSFPQHGDHLSGKTLLLTSMIITGSMIAGVFLFCTLYRRLMQYCYSGRGDSRRRNRPILFDTQENFPDDDEGPVLDHHVWYINTVGLQQSVIDSITMFKYKKDEKLVDGTECSVCLAEFGEDESLRLLPKCSHAFHVPCIDTWLRSHKNCPLCRAPIISNSAAPQLSSTEPVSSGSGWSGDTQMETPAEGNSAFPRNNQWDGDGSSGVESGSSRSDSEIPVKELSRTLSDLVENRQIREEEEQPIRRSVSLDSLSASAIYQAATNFQIPDEASSSGKLVRVKNSSISRNAPKQRGIGNQRLYNLVKSTSLGRSLQKGAISMKRINSSGRKVFSSRHCRSQSSVLPL